MTNSPGRGPEGGRVPRSLLCNRQWTQARLFAAGFTQSANCRLCVASDMCDPEDPDPRFKGTLVHRYWTCPVLRPYRQRLVPVWLPEEVNGLFRDDGTLPPESILFFTKALAPSLEPLLPQPAGESFNWYHPPPPEGMEQGRVYTDGSRLLIA